MTGKVQSIIHSTNGTQIDIALDDTDATSAQKSRISLFLKDTNSSIYKVGDKVSITISPIA